MPRAKDNMQTDGAADPQVENGFAALEAKVEEIQVDAVEQTELEVHQAVVETPRDFIDELPSAMAPPEVQVPTPRPSVEFQPPGLAAQTTAAANGPGAMLSVVQDCVQGTLRLQAEAMASFAKVRGPHDLLAAQIAFGQRAFGLQMQTMRQMAGAFPAFATTGLKLPEYART